MSKKRLGLRITAGLCAALGWWGLLYPELTLTPDTVKVCMEQEDGESLSQPLKWSFDSSLFLDLLNADPDQISFRSRLFTDISSFWEAFYDRNKNGTEYKQD